MNTCPLIRRVLVCLFAIALASSSAHAELRVGAALRVITPDPLLPITGGMGPTEPAREKKGELTVRAIAIGSGAQRMAIVSVDALGFPSVLGDRARAKIAEIPAAHVMIGATHTHSAPDCYAFPDGRGGHTGDLQYMNRVSQRIAEAVNEAWSKAVPAHLRAATGEVQGKVAYNYYAPDLFDRRASVLQFVTEDGKAIATLVNYAVHPEVLGSEQGIVSPDLIGPMCERIEGQVGGMALFMNGAQGGMITADNRDFDRPRDPQRAYWEDSRTWDECVRIGRTLADESLRILGEAPLQKDPRVHCHAEDITFPVQAEAMWAVVKYSPLGYPHNDQDRTVTTRVNLMNLGTAQILTIPGEALPNIGFYLKRKMRGEHNLLFGLTNDAFGYILTKVDFDSFDRYDYISRVSMGEMTGEIMIENALRMIQAAPEPEALGSEAR